MQFYACISGSEFVTSNLNFEANAQKSTTLVIGFCWKWMPFDRNIIFYSFYQYPEIFLTKVLRLVSFLHFSSFFRLHAVWSYQSRAHTNKQTHGIRRNNVENFSEKYFYYLFAGYFDSLLIFEWDVSFRDRACIECV